MENQRCLNGDSTVKPIELSVPLPMSLGTKIYLQLTIHPVSIILFLTTAGNDSNLGSFVCALPNRLTPDDTISTPLYTEEVSLDFTSRLAKLLARKLQTQVYVGNSISLSNSGLGGTVEEEMACFKKVVKVIMNEVEKKSTP
ncbi:hypothetical protein K3495_g13649 [Podosphaera aphanis]|nr:hypothetical protein K3495_g13649 [Podosphaera aphanis]